MSVRVVLPAGETISYLDLASAIAQAVSPVTEEGAEGIACVTCKLVTCTPSRESPRGRAGNPTRAAGLQLSPLLPSGGAGLFLYDKNPEQSDPYAAADAHSVLHTGFQVSVKLTDEDRASLEKLFRILPALRYPMSDRIRDEFIKAYRSLKGRPEWEPGLLTDHDVELQHRKNEAACADYRDALKSEFARGRLTACDASRLPVKALGPGSFIPFQSAVDYLTRQGFESVHELVPHKPGEGWSSELLAELHADYKAMTTAAVAEKYGITPSAVNDLIARKGLERKSSSGRKSKSKKAKRSSFFPEAVN